MNNAGESIRHKPPLSEAANTLRMSTLESTYMYTITKVVVFQNILFYLNKTI
ncbi:hypothetical protein HanRHA438_Chr03g0113871 [Helianthus annuus]|nr:hypothetical protein HanRHA438_Chr03g0113871 [Helianthus annuus]